MKKRGFAAISREKNREISSQGGKEAHRLGKAYKFTSEKAREAGKKSKRKKRGIDESTFE